MSLFIKHLNFSACPPEDIHSLNLPSPPSKVLNNSLIFLSGPEFLNSLDCSIVVFESPNRICKTLNQIYDCFGNRVISIDEIYGDAKFIESQAFAYLGIRRIKQIK